MQSLRNSQANIFNNSLAEEEISSNKQNKTHLGSNVSNFEQKESISTSKSFFHKNILSFANFLQNESSNQAMFSQIHKNPVPDSQFLTTQNRVEDNRMMEDEISFGFNDINNQAFTKNTQKEIPQKEKLVEDNTKFQLPQGKKSKFLLKGSDDNKEPSILIPVVETQKKIVPSKEKMIEEKVPEKIHSSAMKIRTQQFNKKQTPSLSVLNSVSWKRALEHLKINYNNFQSCIQNSSHEKLPDPFRHYHIANLREATSQNNKVPHLLLMLKSFEMHKDTATLRLMV